MKKNKSKLIIILILMMLVTGCTKSLSDPKTKKVVTNPTTGQSLTENILCRPTDKETIELYEKYEDIIDIDKLPTCKKFKVTSGGYDGLWESELFVSIS